MTVRYKRLGFASRDRENVSLAWYTLLDDLYHRDHVAFNVNEGHRTMARQAELVREKGLWSPSNPTGAAGPSANAPHIRTGSPGHAIDFDNAAGVVTAAAKRGVVLRRPISQEPWHVDPDLASLQAYAQKDRKADRAAEKAAAEAGRKAGQKPAGHKPAQLTVSKAGVELVAGFEGGASPDGLFRPYKDPVGVWTIGYGHTKDVSVATPPWTKRHALQALRHELNGTYADPVRALGLPLTQPMFDALVSFVYNLGPGALAASNGIGRELRAKHWQKAADEMLKWDHAGGARLAGLTRRRQEERKLFLSGVR